MSVLKATCTDLSGISILVVEDDFYQAEDTQRIFESAGAMVIGPFSKLQTAMQAIEEMSPDCAVIDLNLGGGPSFVLARALRERDIPILVVSGYDEGVVPDDLCNLAWLDKPIDGDALLQAVKQAVGAERNC